MKYVYFIRAADGTGLIKIGASAFLMTRLYSLQVKTGKKLAFLAFAEGSHDFENQLHRGFSEYRVEGEWFEPTPVLLDYIDKVVMYGVLPPAPMDAKRETMQRLYNGGATLEQIGKQFDLTRERVRQLLRKDGVPSLGWRKGNRKRKYSDEVMTAIAQDIASGVPIAGIIKRYGCSAPFVKKIAGEFGVQTKNGRHSQRFDSATVEKAAILYSNGEKIRVIRESLSLPHITDVYRLLKKAGVSAGRNHRQNPQAKAA